MHSTKLEILSRLKRSDGSTVDELSTALGLAAMTVRQHLLALERDGAVRSGEVRRPSGRPYLRFRLTGDGHRTLSDGYDRLLALIVEQAGALEAADLDGLLPAERQALLFRRAATALAERHRNEIAALAGEERLDRITTVLRQYGGFADWHANGEGYELRDFSCAYHATVGRASRCEWHGPFLAGVLGRDVAPAPPPADACADCCRYLIPVGVTATTKRSA
jgi:predicted ArsR family transcriptional regulator